jgi:DNA-binding GntR family transcriptional regulator
VRERLLARQFGPNDRLGLQTLADELGVSRSPVHHALTRLVSEGLVLSTRRGYVVRPITPELMRESHDVRAALELYAVEQAVGIARRQELARLRVALEATVALVREDVLLDKQAYLLANESFHEQIVDLARNAVMSEMYRRLNVHRLMQRAYLSQPVWSAGDSSAEHAEIVAALDARDVERARAAIRANAETGKRLALEAIVLAGGVL